MTWVRLDEKATRHPKVAGLTDRAFRRWIEGLCYAGEYLTDGYLPDAFVRQTPKKQRDELLASGLWEQNGNGVYLHDYTDFNRTRDEVEAIRKARREAGKKGNEARWGHPR
jgi:hypothetical protein